jgi:hypothetical protein
MLLLSIVILLLLSIVDINIIIQQSKYFFGNGRNAITGVNIQFFKHISVDPLFVIRIVQIGA